jgi:hypothetical protein
VYCAIDGHSKEAMMLEDRFRKAQKSWFLKKYIVTYQPQKTKFRQKCFQKQMFFNNIKNVLAGGKI